MMERHCFGLDVSKGETAIRLRRDAGAVVYASKALTDPDAICAALARSGDRLHRVEIETGRMWNWLHGAPEARGLPVACIDACQADAVLGQMHDKTDANDAAILAVLARPGFYRKVMMKSRAAPERRALLAAREAAINARRNAENTIRVLLAGFGLRLPSQPRTWAGRLRAVPAGQDAGAHRHAAHGAPDRRAAAAGHPDEADGLDGAALRRRHAAGDHPGRGLRHGGDLCRDHRCARPVRRITFRRRRRRPDVSTTPVGGRRLRRAHLEARDKDAAHDDLRGGPQPVVSRQTGGGGKVNTTEYLYHASFAVAPCEGPITSIGRIWADGKLLDAARITLR